MTAEDLRLLDLRAVHRRVLAAFTPLPDSERKRVVTESPNEWFGDEHWPSWEQLGPQIERNDLRGDCDDFALAVWHLMRTRGHQVFLVFCTVRGEGHLVCSTPDSWIADNLWPVVVANTSLEELHGYRFISRSTEPGKEWRTI